MLKYLKNLANIEIDETWKMKTKTIPVVVGALSMNKKGTENMLMKFQEMCPC